MTRFFRPHKVLAFAQPDGEADPPVPPPSWRAKCAKRGLDVTVNNLPWILWLDWRYTSLSLPMARRADVADALLNIDLDWSDP